MAARARNLDTVDDLHIVRFDAAPRRGLRREDAARYVGVSPTKFDTLVKDGRMPRPVPVDGCIIWDIRRLDAAFDALDATLSDGNPWD